jgi:hypothetical protein
VISVKITVLGSEWGFLAPIVFTEFDIILLPSKQIIPDAFPPKLEE